MQVFLKPAEAHAGLSKSFPFFRYLPFCEPVIESLEVQCSLQLEWEKIPVQDISHRDQFAAFLFHFQDGSVLIHQLHELLLSGIIRSLYPSITILYTCKFRWFQNIPFAE